MSKQGLINSLVIAVTAVVLFWLVGCNGSGNMDRITAKKVHGDMSPELDTVALTAGQHRTRVEGAADTTLRQIPDDMVTNILLLDRPSRMSRYPIP